MSKRDLVINIRVDSEFVEKMDATIDSINKTRKQSDPFAQNIDRSKFIRRLVDGFTNNQENNSE